MGKQFRKKHLLISEIFSVMTGDDIPEEVELHLRECEKCRAELESLRKIQSETEFCDIAVISQLASSEVHLAPWTFPTEGGKYTLKFHPSLEEESKGVLTVEVAPSLRARREGTMLTLRDRKGRKLVEGKVVNGKASQKVENIGLFERPFKVD